MRTEMGELRAARQSALSVPRLGEGLARVKDDLQRQVDAASAALNTQAETLRAAAAEDRAALRKTLATDVQRAVRYVSESLAAGFAATLCCEAVGVG